MPSMIVRNPVTTRFRPDSGYSSDELGFCQNVKRRFDSPWGRLHTLLKVIPSNKSKSFLDMSMLKYELHETLLLSKALHTF